MRSGLRRGALVYLVFAAAAGACSSGAGTEVVVRVENDARAQTPEHLLFSWLKCRSFLRRDERVPESGELSPGVTPLASIIVRLDIDQPSMRGILVKGMVGGAQVSVGMAVVEVTPGGSTTATVRLFPGAVLEEGSDGVPEELDACGADVPSGADGAPPDATAPIGRAADAGAAPDLSVAPPGNAPPAVSAGPDQSVPSVATELMLAGTVTDDGRPAPGRVTAAWSQVSGPGTTTFSAPDQPATKARFSAPGTYVLRLTASDGALEAHADVTVSVLALAEGIAGLWHFDEGAGTTAADSSGGGNDAVLSPGARWAAGRLGKGALDCSAPGVAAVVSAPTAKLDLGAGDFTLAAWIRTSQSRGTPNVLVKWPSASNTSPFHAGMALGLETGGQALFKAYSDAMPETRIVGPPIADGRWHHLAGRKTAREMAVFVDGRQAGTRPHGLTGVSNQEPLQFCGFGASATFDFDGLVDEVVVYGRALGDAEIAGLAAGLSP